ncbi:hypothetical protein R9X47_05400 [Wukongibacter baidiensis]|uniref:hypothetical protein n=1 Tax=Wukongibacter baidiensis TaxID=1723361 RepID=UPI003D7F82B0
MGKIGYILILFGILLLIGYGIYVVSFDSSIPMPIKIAFLAIIIGVVIIIINLIFTRRKERMDEDDSSKY